MAAQSWPPGSVGGYRLVQRIGGGGMGEVYLAVHDRIGRTVALKFLRALGDAPRAAERFLNEARIHSALRHENIATLYDFLDADGVPCIVMEYVEGPTLADRIAAEGPLPFDEAKALFTDVVRAVGYLHERGVVHRDIKTANVKTDVAGRAKLLDFGISRTEDAPKLTQEGHLVGTLEYLSPEQLRGGPGDARSDLWSLGILLYEMLAGVPPFRADSLIDLAESVRAARYPPVTDYRAGVPRGVDAVIARCLQPDPGRRFRDAGELLREVERLQAGPARTGSRPTGSEPVRRLAGSFARLDSRRLRWAAAGLGALLAILVVIGLIAWLGGAAGRGPRAPAGAGAAAMVEFVIDSQQGRAEVWVDGRYVGRTPCRIRRASGETLDVVLRQEGFHERSSRISVSANTRVYTFSMQEKR